MKKYILTALLGVFALFGAFASAENSNIATFTFDGNSYTPATITFSSDYVVSSISSYSCDDECNITIANSNDSYCSLNVYWVSEDYEFYIDSSSNCNFTAGTYNIYKAEGTNYFESVSLYVPSSGGDSSSPLLSGGTSVFTSIISSLTTSINEFIPYVVYIGLGLLSAIIGFVAIKRLLNRLRAKIFGTFSGGRRR